MSSTISCNMGAHTGLVQQSHGGCSEVHPCMFPLYSRQNHRFNSEVPDRGLPRSGASSSQCCCQRSGQVGDVQWSVHAKVKRVPCIRVVRLLTFRSMCSEYLSIRLFTIRISNHAVISCRGTKKMPTSAPSAAERALVNSDGT